MEDAQRRYPGAVALRRRDDTFMSEIIFDHGKEEKIEQQSQQKGEGESVHKGIIMKIRIKSK